MRAWPLWCAELAGTALLVGVGCSLIILNFGAASPVAMILPGLAARRALTGFLFGSVGASIALSPVGKVSGAHINPAVTLTFWLERRMSGGVALGYLVALTQFHDSLVTVLKILCIFNLLLLGVCAWFSWRGRKRSDAVGA